MGARLLQRWLKYPLMSCDEINKRYDAIEEVFHSIDTLSPLLKDIRDIERMNMKIKLCRYGSFKIRLCKPIIGENTWIHKRFLPISMTVVPL